MRIINQMDYREWIIFANPLKNFVLWDCAERDSNKASSLPIFSKPFISAEQMRQLFKLNGPVQWLSHSAESFSIEFPLKKICSSRLRMSERNFNEASSPLNFSQPFISAEQMSWLFMHGGWFGATAKPFSRIFLSWISKAFFYGIFLKI